jgi:uncharacterized protein (DUF2062 family)
MKKPGKIEHYYTDKFERLLLFCYESNPKNVAISIAVATCIGVIPLLGATFIILTLTGIIFRLNQYIIQSVHLLVSPVQLLLLYPFIKAGIRLFGLPYHLSDSFEVSTIYAINHFNVFFTSYFKILMASCFVWLVVSIISGLFIYKTLSFFFTRKQNRLNNFAVC